MLEHPSLYNTSEKDVARTFLMNRAIASGVDIKRALTMPSRYAICAQKFKSQFGCHVTGVDLSKDMVRSFDLPYVDEFFCGNIFGLAHEKYRFTKPQWVPTIGGGQRRLCLGKHQILGRFDLMFLDYTSLLLPDDNIERGVGTDKIAETKRIIDRYAGERSVVGVTFTRSYEMTIDGENELIKSICPDINADILRYDNTYDGKTSHMLLAVFVRS